MVNFDSHKKFFKELEEQQQLSLGYYTTDEIITNFARMKFLTVISEVNDCLNSLKLLFNSNYPLLNSLLNRMGTSWPSLNGAIAYDQGNQLQELLTDWCKKWNLCEDWMIENAFIAILSWFNKPDLINSVYWYNHPQKHIQALERAKETLRIMENDPLYPVSPGDYRPFFNKSKAEYIKLVRQFMYDVDTMHKNYGFRPTIIKKRNPQKHFRWLVQYQVLNWGMEEISEKYIEDYPDEENINIDSIKKEIRKIANLIGLRIR